MKRPRPTEALRAIREGLTRLVSSPGEELGRGMRFVRFQVRLWYLCVRRLRENNVLAMSSALSFRTIFAMVPAIVLAVLTLKHFGALGDSRQALRELLRRTGLANMELIEREEAPASQPGQGHPGARRTGDGQPRTISLAGQIERLVERVEQKLTFGRIGPVGVAMLIWTALTLLTTMERSLNRIFGARRSRGIGRRIMLYWTALTLGPILLGLASYASDAAGGFVQRASWLSWVVAIIGWIQPALAGIVVLTAIYMLMPNTPVRLGAALAGAVVAYPLWLLAKWGFSIYVRQLVGASNLYGSLGLVPLFLLWLNLSWYLFLFGAELAHSLGDLEAAALVGRSERPLLSTWDLLSAATVIAWRFASGQAPATAKSVARRLRMTTPEARGLLDHLVAGGALVRVRNDQDEAAYLPARALESIPLAEVMGLGESADGPRQTGGDPQLRQVLQSVRSAAQGGLGTMTLADVVRQEAGE